MATAIASPVGVGMPQWRSPHLHNPHIWATVDPGGNTMDFSSLPMMSPVAAAAAASFNMTSMPTTTHQTMAPSLVSHAHSHHSQLAPPPSPSTATTSSSAAAAAAAVAASMHHPHHTPTTNLDPHNSHHHHHQGHQGHQGHNRSQSQPQINLPNLHPQQAAPWTNGEDLMLLDAKAKGLGWNDIHERYFPGKSGNACRKRHERLIAKLRTTDWDEARVRRVWDEYAREGVRREFWERIAQRCGEKWEDVERVCFQQGLKSLRTPTQGHSRARSSASIRFGRGGGGSGSGSASGGAGSGGGSDVGSGNLSNRTSRRYSGGPFFDHIGLTDHDNHDDGSNHANSTGLGGGDGYGDVAAATAKFGAGPGDHDDSGIEIGSLGPSRRGSNAGMGHGSNSSSLTMPGLDVMHHQQHQQHQHQHQQHQQHQHQSHQHQHHGHNGPTGYEYQ